MIHTLTLQVTVGDDGSVGAAAARVRALETVAAFVDMIRTRSGQPADGPIPCPSLGTTLHLTTSHEETRQ